MNCELCNQSFVATSRTSITSENRRKRFCSSNCQVKAWCRRNLDKSRAIYKRNRTKRLKAHTEYNRAYYHANKEKYRQWHQERYKRVREVEIQRVINRQKRVRERGTYSLQDWKDLKQKHGFRCLHCGRQEPEIKLTRDHIVPLSRGGLNIISNLQPLCQPCNSRKFNH